MQVKLEHIIEGMEMQSEENYSYLNLETGGNRICLTRGFSYCGGRRR